MKIVSYKKTDQGVVIAGTREVNHNQEPATKIDRFNAFFSDVPLHGGKEWKTLSIKEIIAFFLEAVVEIHKEYEKRYSTSVQEHSSLNPLMRRWKEFRGWKAPYIPTEVEIIKDVAVRCKELSDWMQKNSSRPFYAGSDVSYLIEKPKAVAEQLLQ